MAKASVKALQGLVDAGKLSQEEIDAKVKSGELELHDDQHADDSPAAATLETEFAQDGELRVKKKPRGMPQTANVKMPDGKVIPNVRFPYTNPKTTDVNRFLNGPSFASHRKKESNPARVPDISKPDLEHVNATDREHVSRDVPALDRGSGLLGRLVRSAARQR